MITPIRHFTLRALTLLLLAGCGFASTSAGSSSSSTSSSSTPTTAPNTVTNSGLDLTQLPLGDGNVTSAPQAGADFSCQTTFNGGGAYRRPLGQHLRRHLQLHRQDASLPGPSASWPSSYGLALASNGAACCAIVSGGAPCAPTTPPAPSLSLPAIPRTSTTATPATSPRRPSRLVAARLARRRLRSHLSAARPPLASRSPARCSSTRSMPPATPSPTRSRVLLPGPPRPVQRVPLPLAHQLPARPRHRPLQPARLRARRLRNLRRSRRERRDAHQPRSRRLPRTPAPSPRDGQAVVMYHYHATNEYPYTIGCFRGTPAKAQVLIGELQPHTHSHTPGHVHDDAIQKPSSAGRSDRIISAWRQEAEPMLRSTILCVAICTLPALGQTYDQPRGARRPQRPRLVFPLHLLHSKTQQPPIRFASISTSAANSMHIGNAGLQPSTRTGQSALHIGQSHSGPTSKRRWRRPISSPCLLPPTSTPFPGK